MKLLKHLVLSTLLGGLFFVSCKDDKDESLQAPVISSVSPQEALPGSLISISGENFPASVEGLQLSIGDTYIVAKSCTPNKVEFELPQLKAGAYKLKLSTGPDLSATASIQVKALEMGEISFSPLKAKAGDLLIISGSNFGLNPKSVKLYIGRVLQEIKSIKNTEIRLNLSPDVKSGKLKLIKTDINGEHVKEAGEEFTLLYPEMVLSGFSPEKGKAGAEITLTGEHFGTDKEALVVKVNGKKQKITSITNTEVKITLAAKTFAGKLELERINADKTKQKLEADKEMDYEVTTRVEELFQFNGHSVAMNKQGDIYAVDGNYSFVKIAKGTQTAKLIWKRPGRRSFYWDVLIHSNGKVYVSNDKQSALYSYDESTGNAVLLASGEQPGVAQNICMYEDKHKDVVFAATYSGNVKKVNVDTKQVVDIVKYDRNGRNMIEAIFEFDSYDLCYLRSNGLYQLGTTATEKKLLELSVIPDNSHAYTVDVHKSVVKHPVLGYLILRGNSIVKLLPELRIEKFTVPGLKDSKYFDMALTPDNDILLVDETEGAYLKKIIVE